MADTNPIVTVQTPTCFVCGKAGSVVMPLQALRRWQSGEFIQVAWPEGPIGSREQLISGTHPRCWEAMMSE